MGVGSFGIAAALLFVAVLALGVVILILLRRPSRVAGVTLAAHGSLAITAYDVLLAWVAL